MSGCIASELLARSALLLGLLAGLCGGCIEPVQGESPAAHAPPMAGASINGLPEVDAASVLRLAVILGIQDIDRVGVNSMDSCTVWEQPRRVDEIATCQRFAFMWREGTWAERPDALTVDGWCTLPTLDRYVTAHVPVGGRTVDVILDGVSSDEAVHIVSALADGDVEIPAEIPRFEIEKVTGIRRPVHFFSEILAMPQPHAQLDAADVELHIASERPNGMWLILHVGPSEVHCVGWI
jgi:hypothetical protein